MPNLNIQYGNNEREVSVSVFSYTLIHPLI